MDRGGGVDNEKYLQVKESTLRQLIDFGVLTQEVLSQFKNNIELYNYLKALDCTLDKQLSTSDLNTNLSEHLEELHNYNAVKDATQSLLGSISIQTGKSVTELHKEFGV